MPVRAFIDSEPRSSAARWWWRIRLNTRPHSLCSITDRPDGRGAAQGHLLIQDFMAEGDAHVVNNLS